MATRLIILRRPSGSGKSTIAYQLKSSLKSRKIAILEQDLFRDKILDNQDIASRKASALMMKELIMIALDAGYDVIADGIFDIFHFKSLFDEIIHIHKENNFMYLLDVSLKETIRRHNTRPKMNDFSAEHMKSWYKRPSSSGYNFEKEIPEEMDQEDILNSILSDLDFS